MIDLEKRNVILFEKKSNKTTLKSCYIEKSILKNGTELHNMKKFSAIMRGSAQIG
jgi:hypothetical protein